MVRPGFYIPTVLVLVNLDFWKKLPPNLQNLLTEGMKKGERTVMAAYEKKMQTELDAFKKAGVTFIQLSPADAAKFSKMADDGMMDTVMKKSPEEAKKLKELITKK